MNELQLKTLDYKTTKETEALIRRTKVLFLVGPTAAGKNTLENELLKNSLFKKIISHTTRPKRLNHGVLEKEGEEYHFISDSQALTMLDHHEFIEATFTHGYLYGTSVQEFRAAQEASKIAITDLDFKGVRAYRQMSDKIIAVFMLPPSFRVLIDRLASRYGQDSHNREDIKVRLTTALDELNEFLVSDYYYPVINTKVKETVKVVSEILDGKRPIGPDEKSIKLARTLIRDIKAYLNSTS